MCGARTAPHDCLSGWSWCRICIILVAVGFGFVLIELYGVGSE